MLRAKTRQAAVYCMIMLFMVAYLTGCNSDEDAKNEDESKLEPSVLLMESMSLLDVSGAYSYRVETMTQQADRFSEETSEISVIVKPYVAFNSTTGIEEGTTRTVQAYQRENPDGSMDMFLRSTENGDNGFGEWTLNHIPPEMATPLLANVKESMKQNIELLRANKALFKNEGNEQLEGKRTIVLSGAITPDSAVQIYNDYLREYYRKIGKIEDKNVTLEAAKDEIRSGAFPELKSGIPALAFSSNDIPVTIWIDEETHIPVKLQLEKKDAMQEMLGDERIETAITTYELLELGTLVSIPLPEGIK